MSTGGSDTVTDPTAAAWLLIWYMSAPVRLLSWYDSDSALRVAEQVAAQVEHHVLVELRVHVVVDDGQPVLEPCDEQPREDGDHEQRFAVEPVEETNQSGERLVAEDGVDQERQRPRLTTTPSAPRGPPSRRT